MTDGKNAQCGGGILYSEPSVLGLSHDQRGFTILEVVVAVIILALAYTAILQNFSRPFAILTG